jgi:4,5-dihydroxyphthalate decarboxylase
MALSCTLIASAFTEPILEGVVLPAGVELAIRSGVIDDNTRGMIAGNFDIAEMSIGTYVQVKARGADLVALPVFPARRFLQPCIYVPPGSTYRSLADFRGARVAIPQFWMTSSVWHRGLMADEAGLTATDFTWITTNDERVEAPFGAGVTVEQICNEPLPKFFTMADSLVAGGTVDIVLAPKTLGPKTSLAPFYGDPIDAAVAYHRRTGVYPLMHTVVVKGELVRELPGLAQSLTDLFVRGRDHALAHPGTKELELPIAGVSLAETARLIDGDPFPYGRAVNEKAIAAFLAYAAAQGLANRTLSVDEAFADVTPVSAGR